MKKKILIVNNNMKIGGVQKALVNLLGEIGDKAEVTLLLFSKTGPLLIEIPNEVTVLTVNSHYRFLGISQAECKGIFSKLLRGTYAMISKIVGFRFAAKLLALSQKPLSDKHYDMAISFLHPAKENEFYGGTAEFVLRHTDANRKVIFLHCDYRSSGARCEYNDALYKQFDHIACVSDSVRSHFLKELPELSEECIVVRNAINRAALSAFSKEKVLIDKNKTALLSVSRLSKEKGVERVIRALAKIESPFQYIIIGDGPCRAECEKLIQEFRLQNKVTLIGEDINPYRYMLWADLLVVPSYHEAAPLVYQEALTLSLPVLTTNTLSAEELVGAYGFVIENDDEAIATALEHLLTSPKQIAEKRKELQSNIVVPAFDWLSFSRLCE